MLGAQRPRLSWVPPFSSSSGDEVIELAAGTGLYLDEWQQHALRDALGESDEWKCSRCVNRLPAAERCPEHPGSDPLHPWAAMEVGVEVPRQNGKGGLIEARELGGLFLFEERLIIHTAHLFDTSLEAFGRLLALIEDTPELKKRIKRVSNAHGQEGITLKTGQRIRFRTRTKGGGRGFTCDCLILDEAMEIPERVLSATFPTLSARPNPQVWYLGSAVDQEIHENGVVFARVRERGLRQDPDLAYFEFSAPLTIDQVTSADTAKPEHWATANPAMGIRISTDYIRKERGAMSVRSFAVERLGVGDWPRTEDEADRKITKEAWNACLDRESAMRRPICLAFDVSPDQSRSAISSSGRRPDGHSHVEVLSHDAGTSWLVAELVRLKAAYRPHAIVCDPKGQASVVLPDLAKAGIEPTLVSASELAQACGLFLSGVTDKVIHHLGTPELDAALDGATTRDLGDSWAWDRRKSTTDITPLVSATLARWAVETIPPEVKARVVSLAAALNS